MSSSGAGLAPAKAPGIQKNTFLVIGGWFSILFAAFQISGIWWPASGIKWFGGGDLLAQMSQDRPFSYAALCLVIGLIAAGFGAYALSGAGKIVRLKLLRTGLTFITIIYLLRGLTVFTETASAARGQQPWRFAVFSLIALLVGLTHFGGLMKLFRYGRPGESVQTR